MKEKARFPANKALQPYLNSLVGFVKINKEFIDVKNNYECAAWSEDRQVQKGIYPLFLRKGDLYPHHVDLVGFLDAKVTDDHFPALWGGVAISNKPYRCRSKGEPRVVYQSFDIVNCIQNTGSSPDQDKDFFISPLMWPLFVDAMKDQLDIEDQRYHKALAEVKSGINFWGGGRIYTSVNFCARDIAALCMGMNEILGRQHYMMDAHNSSSGFMQECYDQNTRWIFDYKGLSSNVQSDYYFGNLILGKKSRY